MATTNTRYVDPNSTAGGDGTTNALSGANRAYVSATAWEAARQADLPAGDIIERAVCSSDDAGSTHAADTSVTIAGWTTDATRYPIMEAASSHGGKYNENIYRIETSLNGCINVQEENFRAIGIQMKSSPTGSTTQRMLDINMATGSSTAATILIDKCIFTRGGSGTGSITGIRWPSDTDAVTGSVVNIRNCLFFDLTTTNSLAINNSEGDTTFNVHNCTAYNCDRAYYRGAGTFNATNCGAASCGTAFLGTITQTTCSSSSPTFVDEANDDFHLAASDTTWKGAGTDLSGTFADDIDGQTRSGTWDIGADQYVATGAYTLSAESGSFSTIGTAAGLRAARRLPVESGSFTQTGTTATLRRGLRLSASAGAFLLSGEAVQLLYSGAAAVVSAAFIPTFRRRKR